MALSITPWHSVIKDNTGRRMWIIQFVVWPGWLMTLMTSLILCNSRIHLIKPLKRLLSKAAGILLVKIVRAAITGMSIMGGRMATLSSCRCLKHMICSVIKKENRENDYHFLEPLKAFIINKLTNNETRKV